MLNGKMPEAEFPSWLDDTGLGEVGVLTLHDGEQMTVELLDFDIERRELMVRLISASHPRPEGVDQDFAVPAESVLSFKAQAREKQSWPHSDPCRGRSFSIGRFAVMMVLVLSLTFGIIPLFLMMPGPYRIQLSSMIAYTLFEVFFTFAATKDARPYLITCPAVVQQIPRLILRHLGFLAVLVSFQTAELAIRPRLPEWWNLRDNKGSTPFELTVLFLCFGLALVERTGNRALLERAHREFLREP